ncbi:MAG: DNA polymerase III subunit epsilon [Pseudomonadales bacterium]|nr:DNA polymerase III subunit epsilon [Pseudomonadales bacterium]MCP5171523.1 DNA polymerase III subunit epsilon [Pseudomonadales bacterium]
MRQIVLDTETTGLEVSQDHRIIEIGCVELIDRKLTGRHYHQYINPERDIDEGAIEVHGISNEFLEDKPVFSKIAQEFLEFIQGAELVIHNAPFDTGFINHEFSKLQGFDPVESLCPVIDTLVMARQKHPGQKNNLDALCKRYFVDNSQRDLHGALLDAEILADVYLLMTGGQVDLMLNANQSESGKAEAEIRRLSENRSPLRVIRASEAELAIHQQKLASIDQASNGNCVWLRAGPEVQ